jgi:hypothetical protein
VTLFVPFFQDEADASMQSRLADSDTEGVLEEDPLDTIGRAELRRFASVQEQKMANKSASIAAQLRLMGLRPEFTPAEKQLRAVNVAAVHSPRPSRSQAELLAELQQLSAMPMPQILRAESTSSESSVLSSSVFLSSLASFK